MSDDDPKVRRPRRRVLKRFANLDLDGVVRVKPADRPRGDEVEAHPVPEEEAPIVYPRRVPRALTRAERRAAEREAAEMAALADPVTRRRAQARALRARGRRVDPAPPRSGSEAGRVDADDFELPSGWEAGHGAPRGPEERATRPARPATPARQTEAPPTPRETRRQREAGVARERAGRQQGERFAAPIAEATPFLRAGHALTDAAPPGSGGLPAAVERGDDAPIGLSEEAARRLRLMAYEQGVMGAALRVRSQGAGDPSGRPDDAGLSFDVSAPGPDDLVFSVWGLRVVVSRRDLAALRGTRITWSETDGLIVR